MYEPSRGAPDFDKSYNKKGVKKLAYIYIIKNDINSRVYIGKTEFSIEKRFKEHLYDSLKHRKEQRPLYRAISKYGKEHFWIEMLEECSSENASEREIYWIAKYNSYVDGYNATLGGDGKIIIDRATILSLYDSDDFLCASEIAEKANCSIDSVKSIVKQHRKGVNWQQRYLHSEKSKQSLLAKPKAVYCVEEKIRFESIASAERWLIENNITSAKKSRSHISAVCKGKRKTAYGYHWEYLEN